MKKIGLFLGALVAITIILIFMMPTIKNFIGNIRYTTVSSAAYKAYVVYTYSEIEHLTDVHTIKMVFDDCVVTVKDNAFDRAEYENDASLERVVFDDEEATGTYESGCYVSWDEGEHIVQKLNVGDDLKGLHKAEVPASQFPGYEFYGRLEQCDVYVEIK